MSTHNIDFYEDLTKIIFELSSNTLFALAYLCKNREITVNISILQRLTRVPNGEFVPRNVKRVCTRKPIVIATKTSFLTGTQHLDILAAKQKVGCTQ